MIDEKTLHKLEFPKIKEQWLHFAYGDGGRKKVENVRLSHDFAETQILLDETEEAMEMLRYQDFSVLYDLPIIDHCLAKVEMRGGLQSFELRDILRVLNAVKLAVRMTAGKNACPRLESYFKKLADNTDLRKNIEAAVDEEGKIKDTASAALKNIRRQITASRARIKNYLQDFIHSPDKQKCLQDILVTERDGRYVVPVKQEFRYEVRGIIHDESSSGATVFIEPLAVVEQNNHIRAMQNEEQREIQKILNELSSQVEVFSEELRLNQEILSCLDFIFSRAKMAYELDAYRPLINKDGIVDVVKARHPLLGESAVPISINLGRDFDMLVITGPNTGGKTVVLKTLGLLTVMTMVGLFIPAQEKSSIAIFDNIYVDIGDEQSIEQSLSTFSSHMSNIITIMKQTGPNSLVLLDELGAGTDPTEGAALAQVILEELRKKNARVIITTHQSELKSYAFQNKRVENACVEFDPLSLRPTYKLTVGMPGQSNAFSIAERLGLDKKMVLKARELVPQNEIEIGNMLRQLKTSRVEYETAIRELDELKHFLSTEKQLLVNEKEKWRQERESLLSKAQEKADAYIREMRQEADEAINELKEVLKKRPEIPKWHEIEEGRKKLKLLSGKPRLNSVINSDKPNKNRINIIPGDYVFIKDIKQKGYVLTKPDQQGQVMVQVGIMRLEVNALQLEHIDEQESKSYNFRNSSFLEKAQKMSSEIDLRGKLAEEAQELLDKYLDDAVLVGLPMVRVIHGKGTGVQRKSLQMDLAVHPSISSFRDGRPDEGGHGVTIIELK
ncbi:MAG: endonuclease MutS2 [Syntrophomonadaceae bacterium]|jgi:DNA mismatch repair protein MutS2|nr:endonuclease MutS2 [Syntrophomonadaceae bacterium]